MIGCFVWPEWKGSIQIECQEISQSLNIKHKRCQALSAKIVVDERAMRIWVKFCPMVVLAAASTAHLPWTWPPVLALSERAPRFLDCARDGLTLFEPHSCQSQISWHLAHQPVVKKWFQKRHLWNPWPLVCSAPTAQTVFLPTVPWSGWTNSASRKKVPSYLEYGCANKINLSIGFAAKWWFRNASTRDQSNERLCALQP